MLLDKIIERGLSSPIKSIEKSTEKSLGNALLINNDYFQNTN